MLDVKELRNLNTDELEVKLTQLKKELRQYRFQAKTGKLEKQSVIANTKHDVARILTIMNEKQRAAKQGAKA